MHYRSMVLACDAAPLTCTGTQMYHASTAASVRVVYFTGCDLVRLTQHVVCSCQKCTCRTRTLVHVRLAGVQTRMFTAQVSLWKPRTVAQLTTDAEGRHVVPVDPGGATWWVVKNPVDPPTFAFGRILGLNTIESGAVWSANNRGKEQQRVRIVEAVYCSRLPTQPHSCSHCVFKVHDVCIGDVCCPPPLRRFGPQLSWARCTRVLRPQSGFIWALHARSFVAVSVRGGVSISAGMKPGHFRVNLEPESGHLFSR